MKTYVLLLVALTPILLVAPTCGSDMHTKAPTGSDASFNSHLAATADYPSDSTDIAGQMPNDTVSVDSTQTPFPPPTSMPEPELAAEQPVAERETEDKEISLIGPMDASLSGHRIEGDSVIFIFDEKAYSLTGKVTSVAVAGDFNHFNAEAEGWQLVDDDRDGIWSLEAPPGVVLDGHRFVFVINGDNRLSPPQAVDKKYLLENGEGGYILIVGGEPDNPLMHRLEDRSYTDAQGDSIPYRLLVPENYDASNDYPLVVFLHGAGERGQNNDLPIRIRNGAYDFIQTANRYSYFMVIPQCPINAWWGHDRIMRLVLELLDDVRNEFSIDPSRIYAAGLSMGARGMWEMMFREPDVFAAGIAICGGTHNTQAASRIAHVPFLVFHGSDDPIVPVGESRQIVEALQEAGGSVKYTEYAGADHMIWDRVYTDPEVINWLFSQSRPVEATPAAGKTRCDCNE